VKYVDNFREEVVRWVLSSMGMEEWLVTDVIKAMCENAIPMARVKVVDSRSFEETVQLHQGSIINTLLFIARPDAEGFVKTVQNLLHF